MTLVSAPGKLFLAGEYAVLEGAPAVVTAVDRRVRAWISTSEPPRSPVLEAMRGAVQRCLDDRGAPPKELPPVRADSSSFSRTSGKLGLGSSAAVAAASCGAWFEWAGLPVEDHRDEILTTARSAHSEAQGGAGSGADVAASVLGGTIVYSLDAKPEPISIAGVEPVFVWSGKSASTTGLLAAVRGLDAVDPTTYRESIDALIELARALAEAYRCGEPKDIIELTGRYGGAMAALGRAASADIVVEEHERISRLATECAGAAKPSGAGGGDLAVAVFADSPAADDFRERCRSHGLVLIDIVTGERGLSSET
ncbi:MAG: hypothetical protein JRF63_01315 [Deltaproteobacteria bacterium]|nr:hypothetical protein [Deltaproteobacteria bacterium]